jgi:hypothetical protein
MSLFPLLFPYMEQQPLWDKILSLPDIYGDTTTCKIVTGGGWWSETLDNGAGSGHLTAEDRKQIGSVAIYHCPSRQRPRSSFAHPPAGVVSWDRAGPLHDYAFVGRRDTSVGDTVNWYQFANNNANSISSPFRIAISDFRTGRPGDYVTTWSPRDTISWWSDGTSNQILIGEKHFPKTWGVGRCENSNNGDCTYLTAWDNGQGVVYTTRTFDDSRYIAKGQDETGLADGGVSYFGSPHTGMCNFLIGDGSVHGFSTSTSGNLLRNFAGVREGNTVSIP